ncbi:MAG: CHRD domain-containing protein [Phycisphaerae bacterium]|nr:CHRD domain-containing protein [Phycisphaerae bacterium]
MTRSLIACALALAVTGSAAAAISNFPLTFTGSQENPPADPDGTGSGTLTIDTDTNTISWNFVYANIAVPTAMHIHSGQDTTNGPILVGMGVATSGGPGTLIASTTTTPANIASILANPQNFYVNLHNGPFAGGAIRAQIPKGFIDVALSGDQEVGAGDPDGSGSATLWLDTGVNKIFWDITYKNIDAPSDSHIHDGDFGTNGPVFIGFGPGTTGGPGTLIGDKDATDAQLDQIIADPAGFYVNVHNAAFPGGAIRGQLILPDPVSGDLNGDGEVNAEDLAILLGQWGGRGSGDLDGSGTVDAADLAILLGAWG